MEKVVTIEGREIKLKVHGNVPNMFKKQFEKDVFIELAKSEKTGMPDMSVLNELLWTFAKAADKEILPPDEWNESFTSLPLVHCMEETMELTEKLLPTGKLPQAPKRARKR